MCEKDLKNQRVIIAVVSTAAYSTLKEKLYTALFKREVLNFLFIREVTVYYLLFVSKK